MRRRTGDDRRDTVPQWPVVLITVGLLGVTTTGFLTLRASAASNLARLQAALADLPSQAPAQVTPVTPVAPPASPRSALPARPPAEDMGLLTKQLQDYLADQEGTYGIAVIDLATGQAVGINANQTFPTASTFKLPTAMYILNQVQAGKASLDDTIAYTADDYEDGTGVLQDSITEGETHSVRELINLAITQSDNIAMNMLLRQFGRENVIAYAQRLGATGTTIQDDAPVSTPHDMALLMKLAHSPEGVAAPELRSFLGDLLSQTAFHDRVEAGVPAGVRVDHKIGTLPNVVNDVALVYAPGRNFVIAVLSSEVNDDAAPDVIAAVAHQVYTFEVAQGPSSATAVRPSSAVHPG